MNKKQLSINMISQIAAYVLSLGVSFFVTSYVVRYIGTEVYGFVGLANNFMSYLSVITVALSGMINRYITVELYGGIRIMRISIILPRLFQILYSRLYWQYPLYCV